MSAGPIEIILAMDVSYSMSGERIKETKRAAIDDFVDKFKSNTSMALVLFGVDDSPYVVTRCGFTSDMSTIKHAINALVAEGGTPSPLPHIISSFPTFMRGTNGANRYVVVFTDGEWASGNHYGDAQTIKNAGIKILTIGCAGANRSFLDQIASPGASVTGGDGEIKVMFADMARRITQG